MSSKPPSNVDAIQAAQLAKTVRSIHHSTFCLASDFQRIRLHLRVFSRNQAEVFRTISDLIFSIPFPFRSPSFA